MPSFEPHLRTAVALALASGLAACAPAEAPVETADTGENNVLGPDAPSTLVGRRPDDLDATCASRWMHQLRLTASVDYIVARRTSFGCSGAEPRESRQQLGEIGEPCGTATDPVACAGALEALWPERPWTNGTLRVGHSCPYDYVFATTSGDDVQAIRTHVALLDLFGTIDSASEALWISRLAGYSPYCSSVVMTHLGRWRIRAKLPIEGPHADYDIVVVEVERQGRVTRLQTLEDNVTEATLGRRPEGLVRDNSVRSESVGRYLAHAAWLEGAAVVAFERLADDLTRLGAPRSLVRRARRAAADEVRHAAEVAEQARAYGATVPPVQVAAAVARPLCEIAVENAVEGCVRETYGVVEAAYRARHASMPALRAIYATIADDEARHAALSWDVAQWLATRLTAAEQAEVAAAAAAARVALASSLAQARPDAVAAHLGAPPPAAARAMAAALDAALVA